MCMKYVCHAMAWKVVGINFITVIFTLDYVERKERGKNYLLVLPGQWACFLFYICTLGKVLF